MPRRRSCVGTKIFRCASETTCPSISTLPPLVRSTVIRNIELASPQLACSKKAQMEVASTWDDEVYSNTAEAISRKNAMKRRNGIVTQSAGVGRNLLEELRPGHLTACPST